MNKHQINIDSDVFINKIISDAISKHNINVDPNSKDIKDLIRYCLNVGYANAYREYDDFIKGVLL